MRIDKRALVDRIIERLEHELTGITEAAKAAHAAATHDESRAEDQHDTRGIEASYLAGAQAARVTELQSLLFLYRGLPIRDFDEDDAIALGALVEVGLGSRRMFYFVVAQGGGISIKLDGGISVQVVTPQAPFGEALLDSHVGDEIEVESQGLLRQYEIFGLS